MKKDVSMITLFNLRRIAAPKFFILHSSLFIFLSVGVANGQGNFFPDSEHFSALRNGKIVKVEYYSNSVTETLLDVSGTDIQSHILSPDGRKALLVADRKPIYRHSFTARYEVADLVKKEVWPTVIFSGARDASFSPDGSRVAFVRDNDLYVTGDSNGTEVIRVTRDGERNRIINGVTDWVYEEEYSFTQGYEWSPDSRRIAFLRFDESRVREFSMMRYDEKLYPEPYTFKYPKAGEENSVVTLHVYDIETGETRRVDTGTETDQYIPRIGWTPSGDLFFYRVNRRQNHFEVLLAGTGGKTHVIYEETSPRYIEHPDDQTITFLPDDGRFIVLNETRTGWRHLYLYSIEKGFLNAITTGEWEVTELIGQRDGTVWYMSTEPSPLERHLYSIRLNGKKKQRLTHMAGTYSVDAAPGMRYYRETYSYMQGYGNLSVVRSSSDPSQPVLHEGDYADMGGDEIRGHARFFSFTTPDGVDLNGYMIKPSDFDPGKQHPVFMSQYSGPGSQSVRNSALSASDMLIYKPLLEAGYIVACVDGRGTGGRGEEFRKCTYGQLGKFETEDQIAAAKYLGSLPYVDPSRIGIYGWSYGGFMALNCILQGADVFKLAVAVAPVTSWRYYDTIYTETYNSLPQDNPDGYDDNSPINHAHKLEGKLLLIHGTGDDNVHVQNSYEMIKALVRAGKQFDTMVYPDDNHSMRPDGAKHVRQKIASYVIENL